MLQDPYFEPIILVCPYVVYGEDSMHRDMADTYQYFHDKGYPVLSSYNADDQSWLKLEEISPDIIFFTNPHDLTRKEYYEDAYLNYLSCYVPYHHEVDNEDVQYNQIFHNAMWIIFSTHLVSRDLYLTLSCLKKQNIVLSGYPFLENISQLVIDKNSQEKKVIIYAPHHEIGRERPYSTFLEYADIMKKLSDKYKDQALFVFKPHPMLKSKLYIHQDWGKERADSYFAYWEDSKHTQLNTGEYLELFQESDAMIHDCGSFLFEYLYFKKPVMYLLSKKNHKSQYNQLGIKALDSIKNGRNVQDIESFIRCVISGEIDNNSSIDFYMQCFHNDKSPSDKILNAIKEKIK
ncbi:CDP-glycerol glycerophosphotransferase family protein [Wohlfahrtiimonas larvae]|uniref:CDP-glycerol glycerophosphotransferase family protein n=2 Tax=Wohlfahrtiimonas larvae TaxID=1157986 RepID=A0ABP9ME73_9GAMM